MKKLTEMQRAIRVVDATMCLMCGPGSAQEDAWQKVKRAAESVEVQKPSPNSAMDAILALYKRWEATTPKVQHVWGVQEFIRWAQKQHQ